MNISDDAQVRKTLLRSNQMKPAFEDKPSGFPTTQVKGGTLKPITQVLLDRRATAHFKPDLVPEQCLEAILMQIAFWAFTLLQTALSG